MSREFYGIATPPDDKDRRIAELAEAQEEIRSLREREDDLISGGQELKAEIERLRISGDDQFMRQQQMIGELCKRAETAEVKLAETEARLRQSQELCLKTREALADAFEANDKLEIRLKRLRDALSGAL